MIVENFYATVLTPFRNSDLLSVNKAHAEATLTEWRMFDYRPFSKESRAGDKASVILALAAIY